MQRRYMQRYLDSNRTHGSYGSSAGR
jgi:hypothetical protein